MRNKKAIIEIYGLPFEVLYTIEGKEITYAGFSFNGSKNINLFENYFKDSILDTLDEKILEHEANERADYLSDQAERYDDQERAA